MHSDNRLAKQGKDKQVDKFNRSWYGLLYFQSCESVGICREEGNRAKGQIGRINIPNKFGV